ncbi:MAG: hypothetical protein ACFFDK_19070 [Promethearchaeota archaeon]
MKKNREDGLLRSRANKEILIMRDKNHFPRINAFSEFDFLELWE